MLIGSVAFLYAQKTMQGLIVNPKNEPIEGVKIYIKNYQEATTYTDINGNFKIVIPDEVNKLQEIEFRLKVKDKKQIFAKKIANDSIKFHKIYLDPNQQIVVATKRPIKKDTVVNTEVAIVIDENENSIAETEEEEEETNTNEKSQKTNNAQSNYVPKTTSEKIENSLNNVSKEFSEVQKQVIAKGQKIQAEIKKIYEQLASATDITDDERKRLLEKLVELEKQLAENSKIYNDLQQQASESLRKLRMQVDQQNVDLEQLSRLAIILGIIIGIVAIIAIIFLLIARRLKKQRDTISAQKDEIENQKQKIEIQNVEIKEKNESLADRINEIQIQNEIITAQKTEIEEQKKQTEDSIRYALTIQQAILPTQTQMQRRLGNYFVIYKPKDIVSGDFYWMYEANEITYLAVVDCTGHGVPGGFMSLISYSLLNDIMQELLEEKMHEKNKINQNPMPSEVLEELHWRLFWRLKQDDEKGNNDGMDISLCMIQKQGENTLLTFAGAKHTMCTFKNGQLLPIKGTSRSIGGRFQNTEKSFQDQTIELKPKECLYLFTDGYADSPSPDRKKLGSKRMFDTFENNGNLTIPEQEQKLNDLLKEYSQGTPQRDDITIIGIQV